MSYQEFFVTTGAGANAVNGGGPRLGALDAPVYTSANVDSTALLPFYLLTDNVGQWNGVLVGDWLCYDTAGTKVFAIVTQLAFGGDPTIIVVDGITGELNGKTCNVGGAWATAKAGIANLEVLQAKFADGTPPRLNIKGDHILTSLITFTVSWTAVKPFTIQGYSASPGDKPATKPILSYANKLINQAGNNYILWSDLCIRKTGANADAVFDFNNGGSSSMIRCVVEATAGSGAILVLAGVGIKFLECIIRNSGTATGALTWAWSRHNMVVSCTFSGGQVEQVHCPLILCLFYDAYVNGSVEMFSLVNCTFNNPRAGVNMVSISSPWVPLIHNNVFNVIPVGKKAIAQSAANFSCLVGNHNDWYDPNGSGKFTNIVNYEGDGDITTDPNLDIDGRPQAGSGCLGTGTPPYIDIGWGQKQEAAGGGGVIGGPNKRGGLQ